MKKPPFPSGSGGSVSEEECFLHEEVHDEHFSAGDSPGDGGRVGPCPELVLCLGYAEQTVNDPEEGIVEVAEEQGTAAAGESADNGVHRSGSGQNGGGDAGGRDHGHRTGALDEPDARGDQEGQENKRDIGVSHALGDVGAEAGVLDDLAEGAAATGDEQDDAGLFHALFHFPEGGFTVYVPELGHDSEEQAEAHGDDGLAEEDQDAVETGLQLESGKNGVDQNKDDGEDERGEGGENAGQILFLEADDSVGIVVG